MLKALVAKHDKEPTEWHRWGNPIDAYTLATWAGLIDKKQAEKFRAAQHSTGEYALRKMCLDCDREMEARGWVVLRQQHEGVKDGALVHDSLSGWWVLKPTPQGIDEGRKLLRPRYVKMMDFLRGDVRTAIIGIISGAGAAILTVIVLRALGWN